MPRHSLYLGLTGGIGSGKSTVAGILAQRGAALVDSDAISRQSTAAGGLAMDSIRQTFGSDYLTADGALDRVKMRERVFGDPPARQRLEQIIHPLVAQETRRQAELAEAEGRRCIVFDVPLLVESGHWRARVDRVLVVDCPVSTQIARVVQRNQLKPEEVQRIIAQQATRQARLRAADHVIHNDGLDLAQLTAELVQLASRFGL